MKISIDIWCKYFSFLTYQRSVLLFYETLDTLIEALAAFCGQTDWQIQGRNVIWPATTAQIIFLDYVYINNFL